MSTLNEDEKDSNKDYSGFLACDWILKDKLNKKKLESSLIQLAKREREQWIPFYYKTVKDERDITGSERAAIAQWQGATAVRLHWGIETRFDAVALFDDVMRKVRVAERLQMAVAVVTLHIAAKLNEEEENLRSSSVMMETLGGGISPKDLCRMELLLLRKLQWKPRSCLALTILQNLMALVVAKASYCLKEKNLNYEFLNLFLEILMRWLFVLLIQSESASVRPSVLALTLVYYHLDWDKRARLKDLLIPWFQRLLYVSDSELECGLTFAFPLVGYNFYPSSTCSHHGLPLPPKKSSTKQGHHNGTTYDSLLIGQISCSKLYTRLNNVFNYYHASSSDSPTEVQRRTSLKASGLHLQHPRFIVNKKRLPKKLRRHRDSRRRKRVVA